MWHAWVISLRSDLNQRLCSGFLALKLLLRASQRLCSKAKESWGRPLRATIVRSWPGDQRSRKLIILWKIWSVDAVAKLEWACSGVDTDITRARWGEIILGFNFISDRVYDVVSISAFEVCGSMSPKFRRCPFQFPPSDLDKKQEEGHLCLPSDYYQVCQSSNRLQTCSQT